ncbi:hypothetical protein B0H16DRAFT_1683227 [Mycena metata]|uniref:Transmembrane protein n=1 Tax=Mycena metata TaxID=1033252 RepID=A0AAD7K5L7_9AGAR|nr:hypothetical protein B0H16DRAFT_1683227 [Mycena metata]
MENLKTEFETHVWIIPIIHTLAIFGFYWMGTDRAAIWLPHIPTTKMGLRFVSRVWGKIQTKDGEQFNKPSADQPRVTVGSEKRSAHAPRTRAPGDGDGEGPRSQEHEGEKARTNKASTRDKGGFTGPYKRGRKDVLSRKGREEGPRLCASLALFIRLSGVLIAVVGYAATRRMRSMRRDSICFYGADLPIEANTGVVKRQTIAEPQVIARAQAASLGLGRSSGVFILIRGGVTPKPPQL